MEAIGLGLQSIGTAIAVAARSAAFVYIVGIGCKTFLIYTGKAPVDAFKDWFKFREPKKKGL